MGVVLITIESMTEHSSFCLPCDFSCCEKDYENYCLEKKTSCTTMCLGFFVFLFLFYRAPLVPDFAHFTPLPTLSFYSLRHSSTTLQSLCVCQQSTLNFKVVLPSGGRRRVKDGVKHVFTPSTETGNRKKWKGLHGDASASAGGSGGVAFTPARN